MDTIEKDCNNDKKKPISISETFEGQCCFYANSGLPCRRTAVQDGACSLHMGKAILLNKMVNCKECKEEVPPKDGCVDASSNTAPIRKKCMATMTPKVKQTNTEVQAVSLMKDAEMQTDLQDESFHWNGAQISDVSFKKISEELRKDLGKTREEIQMLKLQLEHAREQSKVASMAYKTMEHDYKRLQFIVNSQQKDNAIKKDALLRSIQTMLEGSVF